MATKVIDMRSRPSFLHDFYGATPGTKEYEVVKWLNRRVGSKNDEHFTRSKTIKGFVEAATFAPDGAIYFHRRGGERHTLWRAAAE